MSRTPLVDVTRSSSTVPLDDTRSRARRAVALSMVGKSAEMATLLVLATVVPRALGPEAYGRFSVALAIVTVGSLALTLGGPTTMARYVPSARPGERLALARRLGARLALGRAVQLAALAAGAAVLVVAAPRQFPAVLTALVVVALALNVMATLELQVGLGLGRTGPWSARYPLQNLVLIAGVLALHGLADDTGAVAAIVVAGLAAVALGTVVVAPVVRAPVDPVDLPAGAIRFGALQAGGAGLAQVCHRGGVLAVALLAGSAVETGYAALAVGIALGATYAILQAFTVVLPHLAAEHDDTGSTPGPAETSLRRLATTMLAVIAPAAVIVALILPRVVPALFGEAYRGAVDAFGPALGMVVFAPLNALAVQVSALRWRPQASLASAIAGVAAFLLVAALAVPPLGATGGTAAGLAGVAAMAAVSIGLLRPAIGTGLALGTLTGAAAVVGVAALR
jgi:O-antigen/teichoic acid export membrane protein